MTDLTAKQIHSIMEPVGKVIPEVQDVLHRRMHHTGEYTIRASADEVADLCIAAMVQALAGKRGGVQARQRDTFNDYAVTAMGVRQWCKPTLIEALAASCLALKRKDVT